MLNPSFCTDGTDRIRWRKKLTPQTCKGRQRWRLFCKKTIRGRMVKQKSTLSFNLTISQKNIHRTKVLKQNQTDSCGLYNYFGTKMNKNMPLFLYFSVLTLCSLHRRLFFVFLNFGFKVCKIFQSVYIYLLYSVNYVYMFYCCTLVSRHPTLPKL